MRDPVRRLRLVGLAEGISFLVLLGIAMPLKYLAGLPAAVKYVGWAHGLLFVLYGAALASAFGERSWPLWRALVLFGAALVPGGPFVCDRWLKGQERLHTGPTDAPARG